MASAFFPCTTFTPEALDSVSRVHLDVCERRGVDPHSAEAEQIALTIMTFYQSGITDNRTLAAAMGLRQSRFG
jgi:hypothetical protein